MAMTPGRHKALELFSKFLLMLMMGLSAMEECPPCKSDEIDIREEYPYFKIMYAFPTMYLIQSAVRNNGWVSPQFYTHLLIGYLAVWRGSCVCKAAAFDVDQLVKQHPAGEWRHELYEELVNECVQEQQHPLHVCHHKALEVQEHYAIVAAKLDNMFPQNCKCWVLTPGDGKVEVCTAENCMPSEATKHRCKRNERVCVKKTIEKYGPCDRVDPDSTVFNANACVKKHDRFHCTCPDTADNAWT